MKGTSDSSTNFKYKSEYSTKEVVRDPTKVTYISKNFYSPKYAESSGWTSPKSTITKESKPLFKSSKYVTSKI